MGQQLRSVVLLVVWMVAVGLATACGNDVTEVHDASPTEPPTALTYSTNPALYVRGQVVAENRPSSRGGVVTAYAINALPAGLMFNSTTGIISGTPTAPSPTMDYVVTATNASGSTTATLMITVTEAAPSALTYATNPAIYTKGVAIATNAPSSSGGAVLSYTVTPALPAGLGFDTSTGAVTGTPTAISPSATYTVTATNSGGGTTTTLTITVNDVAPSALTYSTNPATYTNGVAIMANAPASSGGAAISYQVTPALPTGLGLSTATGVITGTPTTVTATASYTVTAFNSGGLTTATLTITVNDIAPATLTYATNPAIYTRSVAIAANAPSSSGGAIVSYLVVPALPAGLGLNSSTGVITGTPTAIAPSASFSVTATNSGGSTSATLTIKVNDVPPSALTYATNPATYTKGVAIAPNTPSSSGGVVVSYAVAPALPAGLNLSTSTGAITGTPTTITPSASYTVTATNSGGSTSATLTIAVNDVPPSALTYATNPATYTKGVAIASNAPSSSGGAVVSYAVVPTLPAGFSLSTATGVMTGTPTAITPSANYTVTATNSGGSTSTTLTITVNDVAPSALTYGSNPANYTKGVAIAPNAPFSAGGTVVSYSVIPALPAGLSLSTATGVITGTPTTVKASAGYTVTATNSGGSTSTTLTITTVLGFFPNFDVATARPHFAAIGDLNGDGKPDVVIVSVVTNTLSVLLNSTAAGALTPAFAPRADFTTDNSPYNLAIGDLNGDGKVDVAVANNNSFSIFLNTTATGATTPTFATRQDFSVTGNPTFIGVGDVNGDGKLDLGISTTFGTVAVFLNTTATGASVATIGAEFDFGATVVPSGVTFGDLNADGKIDLAVPTRTPDKVSVFLNTTTTGATTPTLAVKGDFGTGSLPSRAVMGDFNNDGKLDLAVANWSSNNTSVLFNTTSAGASAPSFSTSVELATGIQPGSIAVGDLDGDGAPDLVTTNIVDSTVSILLNRTTPGAATPSFAPRADFATGLTPTSVAVADINADGIMDLVVANEDASTISVMIGH